MIFFEDVLKSMDAGRDSGDLCAYVRRMVRLSILDMAQGSVRKGLFIAVLKRGDEWRRRLVVRDRRYGSQNADNIMSAKNRRYYKYTGTVLVSNDSCLAK